MHIVSASRKLLVPAVFPLGGGTDAVPDKPLLESSVARIADPAWRGDEICGFHTAVPL